MMADTIRVLALSPIPEEGAGCRFRIAQFIPYLERAGIHVTLRSLFTPEFFRLVYRRGHRLRKAVTFASLALKRLDSLRDASQFDVVFIYREIFPIGPALVERLLALPGRPPVVFDFDDAIFLPSVSDANRFIGALKQPGKVKTIIRVADHVIAGNDYLAAYAQRFNRAVTTIPTCVDTDRFVPRAAAAPAGAPPIVGWIGSPTTATYVNDLAPVLRRVAATDRYVLRVSGTGTAIEMPGVDIDSVRWSLEDEVRLFNSCDVGVYPLTDDEWSRGKCGFKAIQFMACGVPVVASAVGVNREIIRDGVNGFLASTEAEWVEKIRRLLTDEALRRRIAAAGRETIERSYSLRVHAPSLATTLRNVVAVRRRSQTAAAVGVS
jgi:glycosyltransferase involved in cell wall biosynthesis